MTAQNEQQQPPAEASSRRGARWVNFPPKPEEFGAWFKENVKLDPALGADAHGKYVAGVVLIPASDDKVKYVSGVNAEGKPIIGTRPELYYIPYAQVQTRIDYFWDLIAAHAEEGWRGEIIPVQTVRPSVEGVPSDEQIVDGDRMIDRRTYRVPALADLTQQLPPGFFTMGVPLGTSFTNYLCCSLEVKILDRDGRVLRYGRGTKAVPLVKSNYNGDRSWVDADAIMKAETGALGRALGVAGIFVIPGSGVATAEDIIESQATQTAPAPAEAQPQGPAAPEAAPVPAAHAPQPAEAAAVAEPEEDEPARMRRRIRALLGEAHKLDLDDAIREWAEQRHGDPDLGKITDPPAMKGLVRKLELMIDDARKAQAAQVRLEDAIAEAEAQAQPAEPAAGDPEEPPDEPASPPPGPPPLA